MKEPTTQTILHDGGGSDSVRMQIIATNTNQLPCSMQAIDPSVEISEDTEWDSLFEEKFENLETPVIRIKRGKVIQANLSAEKRLNSPINKYSTDIFDADGGFGKGCAETCPVVNEGEVVCNHESGLKVRIMAIPSYWDELGILLYVIPLKEQPPDESEGIDSVIRDESQETVSDEVLNQTHQVFAGDPRSRLKNYSQSDIRLIKKRACSYVQGAQTAALESVLDSFEKVCEDKFISGREDVPPAEVQSVIEALMHLGMVFHKSKELAHEIAEKYGLDFRFDIGSMSQVRMN